MQASALTAWNLYCRRGDRLLFGALDIALDRGAALHLTGPNGTGKSSLLQILAGLRRPSGNDRDRGRVNWSGSVGLLDERPALELDQPLGEALRFWARLDGGSVDLAAVGLAGLDDVPVRYLSTGQTKRAALARLYAQGADHWLLDEPLNGLDGDGVAMLESLVARHRAGGGAVVVASHQPIALPGAITLDLREHPW